MCASERGDCTAAAMRWSPLTHSLTHSIGRHSLLHEMGRRQTSDGRPHLKPQSGRGARRMTTATITFLCSRIRPYLSRAQFGTGGTALGGEATIGGAPIHP